MAYTGRRGAVVALGLGAALLAVAVLALAVGAVRHFDGYAWAEDRDVATDGSEDAVRVVAGREALIWTYEGDARTRCSVRDRDGEVPVDDTSGAFQRPGGSAGDWVARASFEARHDLVAVTCEAPAGTGVMVEPRPHLPAAFAAFGGYAAWGVGAAGLGLVVVLAAPLLLRRRGEPAPADGEA